MKVCILGSGSSGNCTYVETEKTKLLIDVGFSYGSIKNSLSEIGVNIEDITIIFITHTHTDHVKGISTFLKKSNPDIYITKKMLQEIDLPLSNVKFINEEIVIEDLKVIPIKTSHDVCDSNGYILESKNKSLVYITDTGYINRKYFSKLKNRNIYVFESNHDVEMLMDCNRPIYKKLRILGDKGHLSNKDSAYYLSKLVTDNTKVVVLAHISRENNTKEKILNEFKNVFKNKMPNLVLAQAKEKTKVFEI